MPESVLSTPRSSVPDLPALDSALDDVTSVRRNCDAFRTIFDRLKQEVGKVIVGQDEVVDLVLTALFADGHVLLEGVPGLGKTLLIRTLGEALTLPFNRIQFTPDLMPADITGTSIVMEDELTGHRTFQFRPGPVFSQLLLADEINRATPKSQAALLEAMQERAVTVGGNTYQLTRPFFVMATQNPIEQEGTFALPEAQLDRFLFKVVVPYTTQKELNEILTRTTAITSSHASPVMDGEHILQAQRLAKRVVCAPHVQDYVIRMVMATHDGSAFMPADVGRFVAVGVSPRGAQAIISGAKVRAIVDGRYHVAFRDVHEVSHSALRHRIIRSFEAEADGITTDDIVDRLIESLPYESELEDAT